MFGWFRQNEDIGNLLLRLFIGVRLIYGVQDNILHWDHMKEFEGFLGQFGFPFPLLCAVVSVYAQAVAGLMFILGWKVRWAALLMLVNFLVALVMVHWGESFEQMTTVLFMIFTSLLLLFEGGKRYALDSR
jgi:putative oxidoreductase